jgi:hypothetical protein
MGKQATNEPFIRLQNTRIKVSTIRYYEADFSTLVVRLYVAMDLSRLDDSVLEIRCLCIDYNQVSKATYATPLSMNVERQVEVIRTGATRLMELDVAELDATMGIINYKNYQDGK